ncbi:VacJ family lipoprotein [uncultured Sphingomonas sp.]|uniref:MlaA family lipoprotein n=1 Tax=uncultured Sphingomonas sp. TaxID=158754 RepID=UPI0025FB8E24|nr:VacJ family lipoprotein [uncultured Sphingomonas sp.]
MIAFSLLAALAVSPLPAGEPILRASDFDGDSVAITIERVQAFEPPKADAPAATVTTPGDGAEFIVVASRRSADDPLRSMNAMSFELTEQVDNAVVAPVSLAYKQATPAPIRSGLRNFFANLREPVAFANFVLQHKFGKAAETVGRFAINSTIGLAGVMDVARRCPFNLPRRPNGFSDTLGFYGVKPGPYLFAPLIGPTTLRDLVGGAVDGIVSPVAIGGPFRNRAYIIASNIFRTIDRRAEMDEELAEMRQQADPYAARRDRYLERRAERVQRLKGLADADVAESPYGQIKATATPQSCRGRRTGSR